MRRHLRSTLFFCSLIFFSSLARAYPDFIGYGYSSCITCHYSSLGSGALNDYGRALFATEITARDIYAPSTPEETIAAQSGFLGTRQLPWWIRPGVKYRGLWLKTALGSKDTLERYINMQNDVNLNVFFDKKQEISFISTASYTGQELYYEKQYDWFMREFYVRWRASRNTWVYAGQMDKAYGLRMIDHTAVSRSPLTLGQYDQSLGVIAHYLQPNWDVAGNVFVGNTYQKEEDRQKGLSALGEYQIAENLRIGGSVLSSENDYTKYNLVGFTTRMGLSKGSAVLAELGFKEVTDKSSSEAKLGTYALIQTMYLLRRGYNILSTIEHSKSDINKSSRENMRWSLGTIFFPLPRTEIRMMLINGKGFDETAGVKDSWTAQGQIHLSL